MTSLNRAVSVGVITVLAVFLFIIVFGRKDRPTQ
jgi:hypothetical protein